MSNRVWSVLAVGAFATALSATFVKPAAAQEDQPTPAQAKIREKNTAKVKSGKVEPCFGTALKGHNDCYAGAVRKGPRDSSGWPRTGVRRLWGTRSDRHA